MRLRSGLCQHASWSMKDRVARKPGTCALPTWCALLSVTVKICFLHYFRYCTGSRLYIAQLACWPENAVSCSTRRSGITDGFRVVVGMWAHDNVIFSANDPPLSTDLGRSVGKVMAGIAEHSRDLWESTSITIASRRRFA